MTLAHNIAQAYLGLRTERCHGIPHHGSYTVGFHTAGCLVLAYQLFPGDFKELAGPILAHDLPEAFVGDIPSTTKRYLTGYREALHKVEDVILEDIGFPKQTELNPRLQSLLKAVDLLDFVIWGYNQIDMGNQLAQDALTEIIELLDEKPELLPGAAYLFYRDLREWAGLRARQNNVVRDAVARG